MDDLTAQLEQARGLLEPAWDEQRTHEAYAGFQRRLRRRRQRRVGGITLALTLAIAAGVFSWHDRGQDADEARVVQRGVPSTQAPQPDVADPEMPRLVLPDGSRVVSLSADARVRIEGSGSTPQVLALEAGSVRFEPSSQARAVRVHVGELVVEADRASFELQRQEDHVRIRVLTMKVQVAAATGEIPIEIVAGVTRVVRSDNPAFAAKLEPVEANRDQGEGRASPAADQSCRDLIQAGDHEAAYERLKQRTPAANDPEALMDAADCARLSGHPRAAVTYLRQVVDRHRGSALAPMAAFTLGRIRLEKLGDPRGAATAFAQARTLDPRGSLAQDAMAREVEAWSKAGESEKARRLAQEYVRQHPTGRRLRAVKLHGGLD